MKKKFTFFIAIALGCLAISVIGYYSISWLFNKSATSEANYSIYPKRECLKPTRVDLIGTWRAGSPSRNDTLIIRDDGLYKQIIYIDPDANYESEWQSWWLEYTDEGNFIHLEGMNLCAAYSNLKDCEQAGGKEFYWGSICGNNPTGEGIPSNGDGILYAMGSPALFQPSRGVHLRPMSLQELPWGYELVEP